MILILLVLISTYPWPIRPFGSVHQVSATHGDARGSVAVPRFHRGIDIPGNAGTDVFSITSTDLAIVPAGEDYVRVGNYWYIHLTDKIADGDSVIGILDTINTSPTRIGDVAVDHLHFQIGPTGGPFVNPLSYNGGPVNYSDNGLPNVFPNSTTH